MKLPESKEVRDIVVMVIHALGALLNLIIVLLLCFGVVPVMSKNIEETLKNRDLVQHNRELLEQNRNDLETYQQDIKKLMGKRP